MPIYDVKYSNDDDVNGDNDYDNYDNNNENNSFYCMIP